MAKHDEWTPFSWHCANCGTIVVGYRNAQGAIKVQCNRCRVVMVRKIKSRRHSTIDVYAPEGQEELEYVTHTKLQQNKRYNDGMVEVK